MSRAKKWLTCCFGALLTLGLIMSWYGPRSNAWAVSEVTSPFQLIVVWAEAGQKQDLKAWTLKELFKFKKTESRERDPVSGKLVKWKGVLLSQLLESALESLSPENRAQIDLVILKGGAGTRALIPRAMITKYPLMLALPFNTSDLDPEMRNRGPIYSVVPWSTKPKILEEGLPLDGYFVPNLDKIELTSYNDRFSSLYLKRRTDPSSMRGEKLFVQNCIGCHTERDPKVYRLGQQGVEHPAMKAVLKLGEKDKKSLISYLNAYKLENPVVGGEGAAAVTSVDVTGRVSLPKQDKIVQKSFVQ